VQDPRDKEQTEAHHHSTVARANEVLADLIEQPLKPGLYLVATPIGNLGDISLRALAVLARADLIAAEDTRHSKKLTPYHEHNAAKGRPRLLARLRAGASVALISDAGTPLISDPGYKLVREALDEDFTVTSIPGPSAAIAALTSSGLPTDTFLFAGFLPPKSGPRRTRLDELKSVPATLVFFETAPRLAKSLAEMAEVLGAREAAIAKELTKLHETMMRGTPDRLAGELSHSDQFKGEFVLVVAPPIEDAAGVSDEKIVEQLEKALNLESFRDAVRSVAEVLQVPRNRVYELGLSLKSKAD
jgi:16S rRNA (cytidine1402-2'-O)-methyltransferase